MECAGARALNHVPVLRCTQLSNPPHGALASACGLEPSQHERDPPWATQRRAAPGPLTKRLALAAGCHPTATPERQQHPACSPGQAAASSKRAWNVRGANSITVTHELCCCHVCAPALAAAPPCCRTRLGARSTRPASGSKTAVANCGRNPQLRYQEEFLILATCLDRKTAISSSTSSTCCSSFSMRERSALPASCRTANRAERRAEVTPAIAQLSACHMLLRRYSPWTRLSRLAAWGCHRQSECLPHDCRPPT